MKARTPMLVLLMHLAAAPAFAQQASEEVMEEILVTGEMTPSRLRFQLERAQDDIYRLFNQLLDDKEFRVNCKRGSSTGSYIIERSCEPAFLANERARHAAHTMAAWRSGEDPALSMEMALSSGRVSESELRFDQGDKFEAMNQKMFDLAMENPELQAAMLRYATLRADYEALDAARDEQRKAQRCGLFSRNCRNR